MQARKAGSDSMAGGSSGMKRPVGGGSDVEPSVDAAGAPASRGHVVPAMVPPGTNPGGTEARPEAWGDRAGFEGAAAASVAGAQEPAGMAGADDESGFGRRHTATTQARGACHRADRVRANSPGTAGRRRPA